MTRQLLLVAILGLASTWAVADEFAAEFQGGSLVTRGNRDAHDVAFMAHGLQSPEEGEAAPDEAADGPASREGDGMFDDPCCWDCCADPVWSQGILRFGWWSVGSQGSSTKTGEFQDLKSSPFWDVDTFITDGVETWDIVMSGLDNEANDARLYYYSPGLSARVDFLRYLRRLDHDPLTGFDLSGPEPLGPDDNVVSEDLNVGEDYAIRVQQLDTRLQGRLTDNLKWRLNVWAQRKFGERQANATAHCFNINATLPPTPGAQENVCHVLSQRQSIDWTTVEVQPALEAKFENVTVEYSRTMRSFGQSDESVSRRYTRFGFSPANGQLGPEFDYAIVPENFTQIDRIKVNADLTEHNQFYANLYLGDTKNEFRDTRRQFGGFDLRLVNTSFDRLKLTTYATLHDENNELPDTFLTEPPLAPASTYDEDSLRHPVDYNHVRAGVRGVWRPFCDPCSCGPGYGAWYGLSLNTGYEYYTLARDYAEYETALGTFVQPDTKRHQFEIGPSTRWSRSFDTYVRYRARFIEDPLIGVREASGGFNTNQPEQEHQVEVGGTWSPTAYFMASLQVSAVNRWHRSEFANFTEDDYPIVCTVWCAPTDRLSLTGGYAYFSNWIDQDITLGFTLPTIPEPPFRTETTRWDYAGESHMISLNANYAWSPCVRLVGGYVWNRGSNIFAVPPSPAGADWSLLPFLSDVIVETQRFTAGLDWQPYANVDAYVRYVYFDYNDIGAGLDSGTSHMGLAGAGIVW